jgi:hypothetical protein
VRRSLPLNDIPISENKMPIERETIVTDSGRSGVGSGVIIGIAVGVLVVLLIGGITVYRGGFSFGGHPVTIDVPKVTVSK